VIATPGPAAKAIGEPDGITKAKSPTTKPDATPKPNATAQQAAAAKPDATGQQGVTAKPDATGQQGVTAKPNATAEQGATAKPVATARQAATTKPNAAAKPGTPAQAQASAKPDATAAERAQKDNATKPKSASSVPSARLSGYQAEAAKLLAGMSPSRRKRRAAADKEAADRTTAKRHDRTFARGRIQNAEGPPTLPTWEALLPGGTE
jgi:hypothetical protein